MIIFVGFPKAATCSFSHLFQQLGLKTYHWVKGNRYLGMIIRENKRLNRPLLTGLEDADVLIQLDVCMPGGYCYWPQLEDVNIIRKQYPDAHLILNWRDPLYLLRSFKGQCANGIPLNERLFKYLFERRVL